MKICSVCKQKKELKDFPIVVRRGDRVYLRRQCRKCWNECFVRKIKRIRKRNRKDYYYANPLRRNAWNIVKDALRKGIIKHKPCIICGAKNSLAHHSDYSRPLDIKWLCQIHHSEEHNQFIHQQ
jgi:hypothetical protein